MTAMAAIRIAADPRLARTLSDRPDDVPAPWLSWKLARPARTTTTPAASAPQHPIPSPACGSPTSAEMRAAAADPTADAIRSFAPLFPPLASVIILATRATAAKAMAADIHHRMGG